MKHEFKTVLQAGAEEEQAEEQKQEKLKKKFGIKGKNVVVVERTNTFKFTVKTLGAILRFAATSALIILAFIGIVALFYEGPREELLIIMREVMEQIKETIPFERLDVLGKI